MKRRPAGDDSGSGGGSEGLDGALGRFLARHPRFFTWLTVGLALLMVLGLALSRSGSLR